MTFGDRVQIRKTGETAIVIEPSCAYHCIRVEVDPGPAIATQPRRLYLHIRDVRLREIVCTSS